MANSGSFNTTAYEGRYLTFYWEVKSQSVANNSSTISWKLTGAGTGKSGYYTSGNFKVIINGKTVYSSSTRINLYNGTEVASGTATITHNADGTKSFTASAEAGIYYVAVNCKGSGEWSLPTIASAPKITSAPNITNLMSSFTVKFSNPSKNRITLALLLNGTAIAGKTFDAGSTDTSYTFTMTSVMKSQLTTAAGGSVGYSCPIIFELFDLEGNSHKVDRTFTILDDGSGGDDDDGGGSVTYDVSFNPTVVDTNSTTIALTGNKNTLIKYHSNAVFTVGASTTSGLVIENSWQSCVCGSKRVVGSTGTIYGIDSDTFYFYVESNIIGYHASFLRKTIIDYIKLTCNLVSTHDVSGDVSIVVNGNYFNGSFGAANNSLTVQYRYKSSTSTDWSSWTTITPSIYGNTYTASTTISGLDYRSTYTIEAKATDKLATISSASRDISATPVFSWDKDDFEFNVPIYADKIIMGNETNTGIYGTTSSGQEIEQFLAMSDYGSCRLGFGGIVNQIGSTYVGGHALINEANTSMNLLTGNGDLTLNSGADIVFSGDNVYLGKEDDTVDVYINGYNLMGAIRAMTTSYQLSPYVVGGANYSSVSTTAYLLGNNLSGYMSATRSSAYSDGNISPNETVMTVQIPHGGKIKTAYATSFNTGDTGPACTLHISSLSITSTHINFNIVLDASSASGSGLAGYWCMPIVLNLDAY